LLERHGNPASAGFFYITGNADFLFGDAVLSAGALTSIVIHAAGGHEPGVNL